MQLNDLIKFEEWECLNDTIMGGNSVASCVSTIYGLLIEGFVIEENGGFISCKSRNLTPPLDLSKFNGLEIKVKGYGRTIKLAISTKDSLINFSDFFSGGLRWVSQFKTNDNGFTIVKVPFASLVPNLRAKKFLFPMKFNPSMVNQFQLLYSKFGISGELNSNFTSGSIKFLIESISVYK